MDNNNVSNTSSSVSPVSVLIFGILSVALSIPIVGLIFAIIARSKAKKFVEETGTTCGQVNVGKILATIGLILNIVSIAGSVLYVLYIVIVMILGIGMSFSQYMIPFIW